MKLLRRLVEIVANYYWIMGYQASGEWFYKLRRNGLYREPWLELAEQSNAIKIKKIMEVVNQVENYSKTNEIPNNRCRIFDAGCGSGLYSSILGLMGYVVVGVDINQKVIREAEHRRESFNLKNVKFWQGDAIEWLKSTNAHFNIMLAIDVLEHIHDPLGFIKVAYDSLLPHGLLILIIPNGYTLMELVYHPLADILNKKIGYSFPEGWTHIQKFSLAKIKDYLTRMEFELIDINSIYGPDVFALLFLSGFRGRAALLNLKIADKLPKELAGSWAICAKKKRI